MTILLPTKPSLKPWRKKCASIKHCVESHQLFPYHQIFLFIFFQIFLYTCALSNYLQSKNTCIWWTFYVLCKNYHGIFYFKYRFLAWKNVLVVESTRCFSSRLGFDSQHPQPYFQGVWCPLLASSGTSHACGAEIYDKCGQTIHSHEVNLLKMLFFLEVGSHVAHAVLELLKLLVLLPHVRIQRSSLTGMLTKLATYSIYF